MKRPGRRPGRLSGRMPGRRSGPVTVVLTVLLAAALLTGCATVPTSGPVRSGNPAGLARVRPPLAVEAQKPRPNMDQLAIVNGFLEAMADTRAFDVAREYLTPQAAASWQPESRISVYDQSSPTAISRKANGTITLSAPLQGTIDERGSWTPVLKGKLLTFTFQLRKVEAQWRIAVAPGGVFLGSNQLPTRLELFNLFFFNPDQSMLVPDPVYLPVTTSTGQSATQLVRELLKGPTDRLGNAVTSAAPPGTQVNVSVPVDFGVATVALSGAAELGIPDRQRLAAQIAWTLRPISTRVRITVGGAPLLPDEPDEQPFTNFGQYDPAMPIGQLKQLYVVRNHKINQISGLDGSRAAEVVPLNESSLYKYSVSSLAVSLRGDYGAVVPEGESYVAFGRLSPKAKDDKDGDRQILTEGKVLRPSFDSLDRLWILDRADSAAPRLRFFTQQPPEEAGQEPKLPPTEVLVDFRGARPTVFRMAPDGVRALLVTEAAGTTSVQTAVVAATDTKRIALTRVRPLQLPLSKISDASWYEADGILVAGASERSVDRQPWKAAPDGSQLSLIFGANKLDVAAVAASSSADAQPVVQDAKGTLYWQSKDLTWLPVVLEPGKQDDVPVYPG